MTSSTLLRTLAILALVGAFVALFVYLYRTDSMTRFQQTNYACRSDMIGTYEVVLTRRREGAQVVIRRASGETTAQISTVEGGFIRFMSEGVEFVVDTKADAIMLIRDTAASRSICRKTEFRM
jgi:hypothetical protein